MTRRFRRRRTHDGTRREATYRSPFTVLWIIFAILVLGAVIGYDRRETNEARQRVSQARAYEAQGLYAQALQEYKTALANKRIGRRLKADISMEVGDIYFSHFENYDMAHSFYVLAKQNNARLFDSPGAQEKLKLAQQRSAGSGHSANAGIPDDGSTQTLVQRVQLIAPPQEDYRGPVLVRHARGEIRAGELLRVLRDRPEFYEPGFKNDPARFQAMLEKYVQQALQYEAAVEAGVHLDPDVSKRLYDYQKSLVSGRFAKEKRQQSAVVPNAAVEAYYRENESRYKQPATATIGLIKTNSEETAKQAQEALRNKVAFGDVATSFSIDTNSAKSGGVVGTVKEGDAQLPGVGEAPELIADLLKLSRNTVTDVISRGGAFYIFKIIWSSPAQVRTMEEARAEIEQAIRGRQLDDATNEMPARLNERFQPQLNPDAAKRFWQFAAADQASTATAAGDSAATVTAAGSHVQSTATREGVAR